MGAGVAVAKAELMHVLDEAGEARARLRDVRRHALRLCPTMHVTCTPLSHRSRTLPLARLLRMYHGPAVAR